MSGSDVDLLPDGPRVRVTRIRASRRATRTALGLVLIGAVGTAAAEAARSGAFERLEQARLAAARTAISDETSARLSARISARAAVARAADADRRRVPFAAMLAALADALPNDAFLRRVSFIEAGDRVVVTADIEGADAAHVAASLRSRLPEFDVASPSPTGLRMSVPRDRGFALRASAHDGSGEDADAR